MPTPLTGDRDPRIARILAELDEADLDLLGRVVASLDTEAKGYAFRDRIFRGVSVSPVRESMHKLARLELVTIEHLSSIPFFVHARPTSLGVDVLADAPKPKAEERPRDLFLAVHAGEQLDDDDHDLLAKVVASIDHDARGFAVFPAPLVLGESHAVVIRQRERMEKLARLELVTLEATTWRAPDPRVFARPTHLGIDVAAQEDARKRAKLEALGEEDLATLDAKHREAHTLGRFAISSLEDALAELRQHEARRGRLNALRGVLQARAACFKLEQLLDPPAEQRLDVPLSIADALAIVIAIQSAVAQDPEHPHAPNYRAVLDALTAAGVSTLRDAPTTYKVQTSGIDEISPLTPDQAAERFRAARRVLSDDERKDGPTAPSWEREVFDSVRAARRAHEQHTTPDPTCAFCRGDIT